MVVVMVMSGFFFDCNVSKRHITQRIVVVVYTSCMCEVPTVYAIPDLYSGLAT